MILSSLGVIFHPNAITAAVLLVLSFFSLAAIYAVMNAVFIATMQLLVYAGAIMVLVVFVLMLLSLRDDAPQFFIFEKPIKKLLYLGLVMFLGILLVTAVQDGIPSESSPRIGYTKTQDGRSVDYSFAIHPRRLEYKESEEYKSKGLSIRPPSLVKAEGNTAVVGSAMFLRYLLPFELISVLLLAAVLGAVVLGKKIWEKKRKEESYEPLDLRNSDALLFDSCDDHLYDRSRGSDGTQKRGFDLYVGGVDPEFGESSLCDVFEGAPSSRRRSGGVFRDGDRGRRSGDRTCDRNRDS